ncbi:sigma factor-like helix-turn-helix DNA-binding protein [Rossellomorea marisflavi]|uniref:RNA polymerase sigma factor n=1 Tax=Rossellomorea marisflavi TaxID=189381 RepID=UPI00345AB0DC
MKLYELVKEVKNGDEKRSMELLEVFNPLINKYGRLLNGEDTRQDLRFHLLQTTKRLSIQQFKVKSDKVIFSYLAKTVKYEFIRLSKINRKKINFEQSLEIVDYDDAKNLNSEIELYEMMDVLSKQESFIIECLYIHCLSATELAQYMKISRQAVNQAKNRALEKIKRLYVCVDEKKRKQTNSMQRPNHKN